MDYEEMLGERGSDAVDVLPMIDTNYVDEIKILLCETHYPELMLLCVMVDTDHTKLGKGIARPAFENVIETPYWMIDYSLLQAGGIMLGAAYMQLKHPLSAFTSQKRAFRDLLAHGLSAIVLSNPDMSATMDHASGRGVDISYLARHDHPPIARE